MKESKQKLLRRKPRISMNSLLSISIIISIRKDPLAAVAVVNLDQDLKAEEDHIQEKGQASKCSRRSHHIVNSKESHDPDQGLKTKGMLKGTLIKLDNKEGMIKK
jgi:hypothetical protein